mgnify:CR=1 FL=1
MLPLGDCMKKEFQKQIQQLEEALRLRQSFDLVVKPLCVQGINMRLYFVDGFAKDEILEKMLEFLMKAELRECIEKESVSSFCARYISYLETEISRDIKQQVNAVLSGTVLLLVEGYTEGILIDARTYPTRSMEEPEDDRVLRGSRDGFVETLIFNTALIRRRIRDPHLTMEYHSIGSMSKSDIVICYMEGLAETSLVDYIRTRLQQIHVEALTMAHESLAEALVPHKWLNPFPKVRYTERPDTAASNILEGKILLLIDNSPSALILPTSFFDFIQEAQDYYLPPITGTYLRMIRIAVFFVTLLVTPIWYYFNCNPQLCPDWFAFTLIDSKAHIPLIAQLLLLEFGIDALKMASLNTPSSLNSTFSIVGALILGEFAINAGWLSEEIILYMAFVALADFTQPSFELGYAIKFMRVMLLIFTALMPRVGFYVGLACMLFVMLSNKTVTKTSYFYPLFPFQAKAFKRIFIRKKLGSKASMHSK